MKTYLLAILKPGRRTSAALIALIILTAMVLIYFDFLEPVRQVLGSRKMTFRIAEHRLTVYQILTGVLSVIVMFWFASLVSSSLEKSVERISGLNPSNRTLLAKILQVSLYFVLFLIALDMFGINLSAFAVFGGALGVGIGLGLQKVTANFVSGVILLIEKVIKPGDLVEMAGGVGGFVRHIGIRHTRIETADGKEVMIPNEDFITGRVTNWTFSSRRGRVETRIGIGYGADLDVARNLMLETAAGHPRCCKFPPPTCYLQEFGEKSIVFSLFFWVDDVTDGRTEPRNDVLLGLWRKFQQQGIEFAQPTKRDVRPVADI